MPCLQRGVVVDKQNDEKVTIETLLLSDSQSVSQLDLVDCFMGTVGLVVVLVRVSQSVSQSVNQSVRQSVRTH